MKRKILSVGHMEFPLGKAQVQRQLLLAKAIMLEGYDVTILCRYGIHSAEDHIEKEGYYEGVHYVYCSGNTVRSENPVKRNYLKLRGLLNEFSQYYRYSGKGGLAGALVSTNRFHNIVFYYLLGKIFNVVTVVDNVEFWTSNKNVSGWKWFDKRLYDRYYFRFADKIICISDFLVQKVKGQKKNEVLKIPAITDFEKFDRVPASVGGRQNFFLFCGSKAYQEIIDFVIASFEILNRSDISLVLVTEKTTPLENSIRTSPLKEKITVFTKIDYTDLVRLYKTAVALVIPMRDSDQDRARFPHKLSEYCASARPVITDKVGEISNYFDETNSYLCSGYDRLEFARAMNAALDHPEEADRIGKNGYQTGLKHFSYKAYSKSLGSMFSQI